MTKSDLLKQIKTIMPPDTAAEEESRDRWDNLTKPPQSLGKLETVVSRLAGIQRTNKPDIRKRTILCFAGDHGVVAEGVSPSQQVVTSEMVRNFLNGGAAISVLARCTGAELKVYDTGIVHPVDHPGIISKSIAKGTFNMRQGKAMTEKQLLQAIEIGFSAAVEEIEKGAKLLLTGEMGVGNTTAASAIYAAVSGMDPAELTGAGAGLPLSRVNHKVQVIRDALKLHQPDSQDPFDVFTSLGGFELAAMCGVMLAGAVHQCAVLVDGFISGASAVLAMLFHKNVRDYLIFSHQSGEAGFEQLCRSMKIVPLVDLNMKLGEGTGAVMILPLLDQAIACYNEMATFAEAGVTEI